MFVFNKRFIVFHCALLAAFCMGNKLTGQEYPQIVLKLSPQLQQGLQVVYLSDLDILEKGVADYFFDVELWNVVQNWEETRLIFRMVLNGEPFATLESTPFFLLAPDPPVPQGNPSYSGSNVDLINNGVFPGSGIDFDFSGTFDFPDQSFEDYFAASGRLERGIYFLQAILENPAWGSGQVMAEVRLNITNPSHIRLMTPGNLSTVWSEYPLFQYDSDATEFEVYVYKKIRENDDIARVLSGHPTLEFHTNLKQFNYNITDGDPLEDGATYYWYVKALVYTTNGLEDFQSRVWQFTVDTEGGSDRTVDIQALLEPLLGNRAESIAQELTGYGLKQIVLNGQVITLQELMEIIEEYQGSDFTVEDLSLE